MNSDQTRADKVYAGVRSGDTDALRKALENQDAEAVAAGTLKSEGAPGNRHQRRAEEARNRATKTPFQSASKDQVDAVMRDLTALHSRQVTDEQARSVELQLAVLIHENRRKTEPTLPSFRDLRPNHPGHHRMISAALAAALVHLTEHSSRPVSNV